MSTKKGGQYGKDSTPNPAVSKLARLQDNAPIEPASWETVDGRLIKACIVSASENGCAVILGKTSDGGALSFTLLNSGPAIKRWPKNTESAESLLHEIIATFDA